MFNAACTPGEGDPTVTLSILHGNYRNGDGVPVMMQASGQSFQYSGSVFVSGGGESEGVALRVPLADPVWQAIQAEQQQSLFSVVGLTPSATSATGAYGAIGQFLNACQQFAPIQQPVVQQPEPKRYGTGTLPFSCDDGSTIAVTVVPAGNATVANVEFDDGTVTALINVPSSIGKKYSNGETTLIISANTAQITSGATGHLCVGQ